MLTNTATTNINYTLLSAASFGVFISINIIIIIGSVR